MRLHRGMPLPHQRAVGALAEALGDDPAVVVDAGIGIGAEQVPRRLLDALPRVGLRRSGRRCAGARADLGADVHDDQARDVVGPLRGEVHRVAAAHRQADEYGRAQAELIDHAGKIVEGDDGVVDVGRIAVAVATLVERVHVEVRLERETQRVRAPAALPRVRARPAWPRRPRYTWKCGWSARLTVSLTPQPP